MGDLNYPLVSDLKREISLKYGVLSEDGVALRGLFIIDPKAPPPPRSHLDHPRDPALAGTQQYTQRTPLESSVRKLACGVRAPACR